MADDKHTADEAPRANRKQLVVLAVAAVLLFVGGGAASYFLFGGAAPPAGDEAAAAESAVEEGDPVYHALKPTFVVSLPPGGPVGMLQVAIEVMTRTPSAVETLKENDPVIRHHLLNLLEEQDAAALLTLEGKQALQAGIHTLLNSQLAELEEPGKVAGVFFTQFVMQ